MIYLQNNRGVAAVELAICLPILILLVCGSIEFGLLFYNQQVITNASREGARAGIVEGTVNADIEQIVKNYCTGKLINLNGANELQADAVTVSGSNTAGGIAILTVRVIYNYDFLFGGILDFTNILLSAQTIMRME